MVDSAKCLQNVTTKDINHMGQLIDIKNKGKLGSDTEGMGTYDDYITTYSQIRMIITPPIGARQVQEEEGTIQNRVLIGQVKYDQALVENDVVVTSDGTKLAVTNVWEHKPAGTVICKFCRMVDYAVVHGNG